MQTTARVSVQKNDSGKHTGNRWGECAGQRAGEQTECRTDNHAKARAGKWLKRE